MLPIEDSVKNLADEQLLPSNIRFQTSVPSESFALDNPLCLRMFILPLRCTLYPAALPQQAIVVDALTSR